MEVKYSLTPEAEEVIEEEEILEEEPKPLPVIRPKPRAKNMEDKPLINNLDNIELKYGGKKPRKRQSALFSGSKEATTGWFMK